MSEKPRWEIRAYREGDEHAIVQLFNAVFEVGNPDFVHRTLAQWHWAFRDNPMGHHTFVAEVEGKMVGQYTAQPSLWRFPHGVHLGAQAIDTCVAPEYRRSLKRTGLFLSLAFEWFDHFARPECDNIVWGLPNPQAFRIGTRRVDYRPVRCPVPERSLPLRAASRFEAEGIHIQSIDAFGREIDAFDEQLASKHHPFSLVRNAAHMNWRYTDNPNHSYRLLRAEGPGGELRGFLVYTLGWHGDRKDIVPLVDFLVEPDDTRTWRALLGHAAREGEGRGLREFLTWTPPGHAYDRFFDRLGFQTADSRFNLCIRIFCDSFDVAHAIQHWYLIMGDSDIY